MGLSDRVGEWDDRSSIYSVHDPEQRVSWIRLALTYVIGTAIARVGLYVLDETVGRPASLLVALVLSLAFVVAYVVWRRRRNRRLTGSPTRWPSTP